MFNLSFSPSFLLDPSQKLPLENTQLPPEKRIKINLPNRENRNQINYQKDDLNKTKQEMHQINQASLLRKRALETPVYPSEKKIKISLPEKENMLLENLGKETLGAKNIQTAQKVFSRMALETDPLKADLDEKEKNVHQAIVSGSHFVCNNQTDKPQVRLKLDSGESVIFKGNPDGNRGKIETFVYDAAKCCQRGDLIVPVKEANWPTDPNKKGAMQILLAAPRFITLDILLGNCQNGMVYIDKLDQAIPFKDLIQALLLEFVFGMSDCIDENILIDTQEKKILHFDNEDSFPKSNEDQENLPFKSSLLWFSSNYKVLSSEERELISTEIANYQRALPQLKFMLDFEGPSFNALNERLNNLVLASHKLNCGEINTLADLLMAALPEYKKVMFLKMAVILLDKPTLTPVEIKRLALGEQAPLDSHWNDLVEEIEDKQLLDNLIHHIKNDWSTLSIDDFLTHCRKFLFS